MKRILLILIVFASLFLTVQAQKEPDILIIKERYDIPISEDKLLSKVKISGSLIRETKSELIQQCLDKVKLNGGNCLKITHYSSDYTYNPITKSTSDDAMRANIYLIDKNEIEEFEAIIKNYSAWKKENQLDGFSLKNDSLPIVYRINSVFQYGGESQITLLPKFNILRQHRMTPLKPYYGLEAGIYPMMIAGAFSFSGIVGIEKSIVSLESSVSHFRTTKINDGESGYDGPYRMNLINLKIGLQIIKKIRLKIGTSFILDEYMPEGEKFGEINGNIYGLELQINLK